MYICEEKALMMMCLAESKTDCQAQEEIGRPILTCGQLMVNRY